MRRTLGTVLLCAVAAWVTGGVLAAAPATAGTSDSGASGARPAATAVAAPHLSGRSAVQAAPRVVGGAPIAITEAPWQVLLIVGRSLCSGSLVTLDWVLTAAHCVSGISTERIDIFTGITAMSERNPSVRSAVSSTVVHPAFDPNTFANDIALVQLAAPVVASSTRMPIALPIGVDPSTWPPAGTAATVSGWGTTQPGSVASSDALRRATIQILTAPGGPCGAYDSTPAGALCAGVPSGGVDTCQGDSGGPLVVGLNGANVLAGVTSAGDGCANAQYPGIYTSTAYFLPWIGQTIPLPTAPTPPGAPATLAAQQLRNGGMNLTWQPPTDLGSSPITGYTVTAAPTDASLPALTCTTTGALTCAIANAAPGTRYDVSVAATNAVGTGPGSASVRVVAVDATRRPGTSIPAARLGKIAAMSRPVVRVTVLAVSREVCTARGTTLNLVNVGNCRARVFDARHDHTTIFVGVIPPPAQP